MELDRDTVLAGVAAILQDPSKGRYYLVEVQLPSGPGGFRKCLGICIAALLKISCNWCFMPLLQGGGHDAPVAQLMITLEWSDWYVQRQRSGMQ